MTAQDVELGIYNDAIRRDPAELVTGLREILGAQLVAYVGNVRETSAVRDWAEGALAPPTVVVERLRLAYRAARLLERHEGKAAAQAWFQGMNPQIGDAAPAELIREGDPAAVMPQVLAAARAFVRGV